MRRVRKKPAAYQIKAPVTPFVDVNQLALELNNLLHPKETASITLNAFQERWIDEYARANRQKPRGIDSKQSILRHHLLPRFGHRPMNSLVDADVQALKAALAGSKPKTVNNILTVLNKLLKTAVKWRVLERMPVTIELVPVPPPGFSFYEIEPWDLFVIAAEADAISSGDMRKLAMILLGGDQGLRMGEIIALEWEDVDLLHEVLTVRQSESRGEVTAPKGGRSRVVPMTQKTVAVLTALWRDRPGEGRVLRADGKEKASEQNLRTWISNTQGLAGLKKTGALHILRHTFCSHLAIRGATVLAIKELAGHQSLRTTLRYMHLGSTEARRAIALLDRTQHGSRPRSSSSYVSPAGFEPALPGTPRKSRTSRKSKASPSATETRVESTDANAALWAALEEVDS